MLQADAVDAIVQLKNQGKTFDLILGFLSPINSTDDLANSQVIFDIEQASLKWDKNTVKTVFNSFFYDIIELYYLNSQGQKFDDLDMELAKNEAFNLW